jgi:hypothetical protein
MIRLLVTSQAFQRSGDTSARAREVDPGDALLQHYPLRRIDAETLRDSLLSTAGKLRDSMYGESVQPFRDNPTAYRRLFSGPVDGDGRRSVYVKVTRMEGPKFLETFDYPNPMATRGARDVTNVPAQALTLLNDPLAIAAADAFATRLCARPATTIEARIDEIFRAFFARIPQTAEREQFAGLARQLGKLAQVPDDALPGSQPIWKDVVHAVLNLKEMIYVQ